VVDEGPARLTQVALARVVFCPPQCIVLRGDNAQNEPDNTEEVEIAYSVSDKEQGVGPVQAWRAAGRTGLRRRLQRQVGVRILGVEVSRTTRSSTRSWLQSAPAWEQTQLGELTAPAVSPHRRGPRQSRLRPIALSNEPSMMP
jgi:hypothetical protein